VANHTGGGSQYTVRRDSDVDDLPMNLSPSAVSRSRWYWLCLLLLALSMEAVGLFYQYGLEELPCRLCIVARLWVAGLLLVSVAGLLLGHWRWPRFLIHLASFGIAIGLAETSYQLLGTERGFLAGECSIELGTPDWFRPDLWLPGMFEPQVPCGYTPLLPGGISMAEALVPLSAVLLLVTLTLSVAALRRSPGGDR
jgi:protein dithiol:quinone oxidoreductase